MGLDSIWTEDGEYLKKNSEDWKARTTGCSCCSCDIESGEGVRREAVESLSFILRAVRFFKWDINRLIKEAWKEIKREDESYGD